MSTNENIDQICCPEFNPAPWEDKHLIWENKKFIKDKVCTLFYMPLNFGSVMKKLNKKITEVGADTPEWMCLSDHTSKWNMNVYLEVNKEVPNAENLSLSGKFYSKVYDGPFKETGKWMKDFENSSKSMGLDIEKYYMWYTTCPKCAKKYGHNYVVVLGKEK